MQTGQATEDLTPDEEWLTLPDASRRFGVSSLVLRQMVQQGDLPSAWHVDDSGRHLLVGQLDQQHPSHTVTTLPPETCIVGRSHEIEILTAVLEKASTGSGSLVIIGGDTGIGKTTLVEASRHIAQASGFEILSGHCYDVENATVYGIWQEAFSTAPAAPAFFHPDVTGVQRSGASDLFSDVEHSLQIAATNAPLLVILEDIHWADRSSLDLLRFVARRIDSLPIVIIATYRDTDLLPDQPLYLALPHLVRESPAVRINLRPLGRDDVGELLQHQYHLPDADAARLWDYIWRYAEGNPFFTGELAIHLEHAGILERRSEGWELGELPEFRVPPLIQQVIAQRLERVSSMSIRLLRTASVIGVEVRLDLWQAASQVGDDDLATCIDESLQSQIIQEIPHRNSIRFRHALIRQALYDGLQILRRREQHVRIAGILESEPRPDASLVAHHYLLAHHDRAIEWLIRAGREAAGSFAFQPASERFVQAMTLMERHPGLDEERAWLACELAAAYRYIDPEAGLHWASRAAQLAASIDDPALQVAIAWIRSHLRGFLGEDGLAELQDSVARLESLSSEDYSRIQETSLGLTVNSGLLVLRIAYYARFQDAMQLGLEFLRTTPVPTTIQQHHDAGVANLGLGMAQANLGLPDEARSSFAAARDHLLQAGNHYLVGSAYSHEYRHVIEAYMPERTDIRRNMVEVADDHYRRSVMVAIFGNQQAKRLFGALFLDGRWDELRESAEHLSTSRYILVECAEVLAELEYLQGQFDRAWSWIDTAIPEGASTDPATTHYHEVLNLQRVAAEIAMHQQQPGLALAWIQCLERWLAWGDTVLGRHVPSMLMARYCQLNGDIDAAFRHASRAVELAQQPRQPLGLLRAERLAGEIMNLAGDHDRAERHLGVALDLARAIQAPYEVALSEVAYAAHLVAGKQAANALPLLAAARPRLELLHAAPALAMLDVVEAQAIDLSQGGAQQHGLSPREVEVLRLVAQGLTDAAIGEQLFISRRTVSGHVQSIFNKCGVTSRAAATAFAYEHRIIAPGE